MPPYFTGYVACSLCPGSFIALGQTNRHNSIHERWKREGDPPPVRRMVVSSVVSVGTSNNIFAAEGRESLRNPVRQSYPQEESENLSYTSGTFIGTAEDAVNGSSGSHEEGEGKLPHRA